MSLELTDEERSLVALPENATLPRERRLVAIILKTQAGKMKAEFRLEYHASVYYNRNCDDPRHTWTDEQWLEAAQAELSREGKG